ncbi:MAG TPA: deoxynucleoside kinase [Anaerolineaceae bacterium]|jgi:deoxyadenosine/deoxycytidine kinase|nr:deoxynucleoside kinase [Anaerolineaceae bacterium]HOT26020.1 deoxynucleoside kinase [Anaerolineaceae bacterium]HQH58489.1 deoxynucleoside kinase [Anaerolineaceae bacterium]HQK02687.1 deoxynucleoside kinase [Anaerolineaceae bacterium]HQL27721.1 deoxynucleoside kinase [Anaerolineaceae bacterium]
MTSKLRSKKFVLMAGNIGSGKTSLTRLVGEKLGWQTAYESVSDNPYLADFYKDMRQWSFHLQVYFLGNRAAQHIELAQSPRSAIIDRSIYEDARIFARALNAMGNLQDREYQAYLRLYDLIVSTLPRPDLLIFLKAPVNVLLKRIQIRARSIEDSIDPDYLALLDKYYAEWIDSFDLCPVLTIESDAVDFVNKPEQLDLVTQRILDRLAGTEKLILD